jgi:RNA polymerase sigma-70 factor (ECF subfamily)
MDKTSSSIGRTPIYSNIPFDRKLFSVFQWVMFAMQPLDPSLPLLLLGHSRQHLESEVTRLFDELRDPLFRYLLTFGLPSQDVEEVIQEVFLALFQHLRKGRSRENLRGWVFRVGHNLALKHRNRWNMAGEPADQLDPALNPEEQAASAQQRRRLAAVVRALPEQDRACLFLRAEGLRYRDIGEVLGISLGSVAASLERSLERLSRVRD